MTLPTTGFSYTVRFDSDGCRDTRQVGGKAHGLAAMTAAGLPVAPGFAVTAAAYREFLDAGDLRARIGRALASARADRPATLVRAEQAIAELITASSIPDAAADGVCRAYAELCAQVGVPDLSVAVRSSATAEDSSADSFAGEFETWVDVTGAEEVVRHVHRCYAGVFAERVLSYAFSRGIRLEQVEMAVVVQKTVRARAAGVMFTLDPVSGDRSKIVMESSWGLGLSVVGGEVTPDRFIVDKVRLDLAERHLSDKHLEYRRGDAATEVPAARRSAPSLTDDEVLQIAELGKRLEKLHGRPQDVEFAVDEDLPAGSNVILLQCRPETVWSNVERKPAFDASAGVMSWITSSITKGVQGPPASGHHDG